MKIQTVEFAADEVVVSVGWLRAPEVPLLTDIVSVRHLIAYEPQEKVYDAYIRYVRPNFKPVHRAVMGREGTVELVGKGTKTRTVHAEGAAIQAVSLDSVIDDVCEHYDHIDKLLLNCEGAEFDILCHTDAERLRRCEFLFVQFHHWLTGVSQQVRDTQKCVAYLEQIGFESRCVGIKWYKYHFYREEKTQ